MEMYWKTWREGVLFLLCVSSLLWKWLYLTKNTINHSNIMEENEQACSYGLTTNRGLHHKQSVEGSISTIFYSCFLAWAWWFGGVMVNFWVKWSKILQNTKKNHTRVYNRTRSINYNTKHIILPKNGTKWSQNSVHFKDLSNFSMLKPLLVPKQLWNWG